MGVGIVAPPEGGGFMSARYPTGRSFAGGMDPFYKESNPAGTTVATRIYLPL